MASQTVDHAFETSDFFEMTFEIYRELKLLGVRELFPIRTGPV